MFCAFDHLVARFYAIAFVMSEAGAIAISFVTMYLWLVAIQLV